MKTEIKISGSLVGKIWMPSVTCWKDFSYDVIREQARTIGGKMTLRDHVLRATNDGDFQSCEMGDSFLTIKTSRRTESGAVITRSRSWPMEYFPSVSDCVIADWVPEYSDGAE